MTEAATDEPGAESPPPGDIADVRRVAELTGQKRELEAQLKAVEAQLDAAKAGALRYFEVNGVDNVSAGGYTVYLRRQLWAKVIDPEAAIRILPEIGWDDYVKPKINSQTLSARLRELDRDGVPIPSELDGVIGVSEVFEIRATKK